jgi:hydrogenase-4 component F
VTPWLLVLAPLAFAVPCATLPWRPLRLVSLVAGGAVHLGLVACSWILPAPVDHDALLALDPLGHLFLTLTSVLFLATAVFFVAYHQKQLVSMRVFLACLLALLSTLTVVFTSQHLGLLWVALESASLAATPLIYFRLGPRALAATWKFLIINSVGVAMALLGILCVGLSTLATGADIPLTIEALGAHAPRLDPTWLRAGYLLALVGFGTKMGLAPLHGWKPDAYGEAPPPVAGLLAGAMPLGAFTALMRVFAVCVEGGHGAFARGWLVVLGLLSVWVAAVFIVDIQSFRRLLAYTSVEHVGIMALAVGVGGAATTSCMLHAVHNTLNKGVLFFLAGYLWRLTGQRKIGAVRGLLRCRPAAGALLVAGTCATMALPPFGMFFSEWGILVAAARDARAGVLVLFSAGLVVLFVALVTAVLPMALGDPSEDLTASPPPEPGQGWRRPVMLAPALALLAVALLLGPWQPAPLRAALEDAARTVTGLASAAVVAGATP